MAHWRHYTHLKHLEYCFEVVFDCQTEFSSLHFVFIDIFLCFEVLNSEVMDRNTLVHKALCIEFVGCHFNYFAWK